MNNTDVLVIGGGISGLSTAWWIAQTGLNVEVWEADKQAGGKIRSQYQDGYLTERAASMLMNFRPEVSELIKKSGLETFKTARLPAAKTNRYLLQQGKLQAAPMRIGKIACSSLLSWRSKLRLLAESFIPSGGYEDEPVSHFIIRRLGKEILENAIEPFVAGTLASDPDLASATATLPRLTALENRYGSITAGIILNKLLHRRTACMTDTFSFHNGMSTLVTKLMQADGITFRSNHAIEELEHYQTGWKITATTPGGQRSIRTNQVVVTTPAPVAASLLSSADIELARILRNIQYASLAVVHTGIDKNMIGHALDGTGFLVPRHESQPFNGNLWMSTLFAGRAPEGKALLTSYVGGARRPSAINWDDEVITGKLMRALTPLLKLKGDPEMVRIDRHQQALPLYHGKYQAQDHAIATRLQQHPGLYVEANYRGGISVRDRLARGRTVAKQISTYACKLSDRPRVCSLTPLIDSG